MRTKDYVEKYKLNISNKFNHSEFISDFTHEFITLLETGNSTKHFKGYENTVRAIRMKWDAISNKTVYGLPDKLWNFFYATVIAKTKEKLFPEEIARQKEIKEEMHREWESRKRHQEDQDSFFWQFLFAGMVKSRKPVDSYAIMEISSDATADDVKNKYRELSMKLHPDKGGSSDKFIAVTEAKNKILSFLQ